jgi:hypothetical protein
MNSERLGISLDMVMDHPGMRLEDAMVRKLSPHCNPTENLLPVAVGREAHDSKEDILPVELGTCWGTNFRSKTRERRARSQCVCSIAPD